MLIYSINDNYYLIVTYILMGLLGLCIGSFLNVVIYRVPLNMSIAKPASHCPKCNYKLKWYDNIPILSYIILKGKCRNCKEHISFRYTFVEILNTLLYVLAVYLFNNNIIYMVIVAIASSVCICIAFIDIEHMIIPDRFQIILLLLGILSIFCDSHFDYVDHLIGLGAGIVLFLGIALLAKLILKKEALGGGDVKLGIVSGLLLGWQNFLVMALIASILGSIYMITMTIIANKKKDKEEKEKQELKLKAEIDELEQEKVEITEDENKEEIEDKNGKYPFGPFLAFGLIVSLMCGYEIIHFYLYSILKIA